MVNRLINNMIDFQDANEAFQYLKDTLKLDYPLFIITSESFTTVLVSALGSFEIFEIWLEYNGVQFKIGWERGVLLHQVNEGKEELRLHRLDKGMGNVLAFSRKNVQYTISVFKRFVEAIDKLLNKKPTEKVIPCDDLGRRIIMGLLAAKLNQLIIQNSEYDELRDYYKSEVESKFQGHFMYERYMKIINFLDNCSCEELLKT